MSKRNQYSLFPNDDTSAPHSKRNSVPEARATSQERNRSLEKSKQPASAVPAPKNNKERLLSEQIAFPRRYLTDKEVARYFSVGRATIWRWTKQNPEFPKPIRISGGTSRWLLEDLQSFETSLWGETK